MAFFVRCISGNSLKGMVRDDDDDFSGSTTPNDTAHGGSKFSSYSWKRLSAKSRSSLNSPKKPHTPPLSATSADGTGPPRASMEPVMERTRSALTDLEAVKFLVEDWSHKHWRPATPQDQERFDRLEQSDIKPLVALGEGAYGSVNLCRIAANAHGSITSGHPAASALSATMGQAPQRASISASGAANGGGSDSHLGQAKASAPGHRRSQSIPTVRSLADAPAGPLAGRPTSAEVATPFSSGSARAGNKQSSTVNSEGSAAPEAAAAAAAASGSGPEAAPNDAAATTSSLASSSSGSGGVGAEGEASGSGADQATGPDAAASSGEVDAPAAAGGDCSAAVMTVPEAAPSPWVSETMRPASSITDPQLIVAVKRVPLGWNQERELMQLHRCQQCPFIVRLFGFVDDGSEHCSYVMEWAEGGDLGVMLSSLKSRRGANKQRLLMSEASARYYMGCLLLALEFLHANGLLHRDIKPSNLLLTSDGTAKLADLGFTVALDANGQTVGCCGTTGYIAPEVYSYGSAKSRMGYGVPADIWSAGATLYQILTGHVVTDHPEEVLKKGWRPPTHPRFSHELQDLLNRMLAVKPHSRPQCAASVMRHAWFQGFGWTALREGYMQAPYVPSERRRRRQTSGGDSCGGSVIGGDGLVCSAAATARGGSSGGGGCAAAAAADAAEGPPTTCPGGQRLAPVIEGVPSMQAVELGDSDSDGDGDQHQLLAQRSTLSSGQGEGSVRQGREGLVRAGSSFETALGTVSVAEARAVQAGAAAIPVPAAVTSTSGNIAAEAAAAAPVALAAPVASEEAPCAAGTASAPQADTAPADRGGRPGECSTQSEGGVEGEAATTTAAAGRLGGGRHEAHGHNHQGLTVRFAVAVARRSWAPCGPLRSPVPMLRGGDGIHAVMCIAAGLAVI